MKPIIVNGYFITLHSPSKNAFRVVKVDFSGLTGSELYKMIEELEELMNDINEEYRKRNVENVGGSNIRAEFRRARAQRRRTAVFSPYPKRFENIVGAVRTRLYNELNLHAIVISNIEVGVFRRNVYLLPRDEADSFLAVVDTLNRELDELRDMVEEYHRRGYFDKVLDILSKYNVQYGYHEAEIRKIYVNMLPVVLDPDIIKPYVSPRVRREIEALKKKAVIDAVKSVEKKIRNMVNQYIQSIKAKKFNPREAAEQLNKLRESINNLGIVNIDPIVNPLIELCRDPEKLEKEALSKLSGKVKALLENL